MILLPTLLLCAVLTMAMAIVYQAVLQDDKAPLVTLDYATFQGMYSGNLTMFLGMPFANAPIGDLRFRRPTPPSRIGGIQQATEFGAACPQHALSPLPGLNFTGNYQKISEDCLTINVIAPASKLSSVGGMPVLVLHEDAPVADLIYYFLLQGGFEIGDATETPVETLVERSILRGAPIMVVVPNYRLNGFGFLSGKEVSASGVGNLGLHDQRLALQWVQDHISHFGGDPSKVTIWGSSAGAISVGMHLVSYDGDHGSLFHGAFMLSGAPMRIPSIVDGQAEYDLIVAETNCSNQRDTLTCLRKAPYDVLMTAINKTRDIFSYTSLNVPWQPRVDGDLLRHQPYEGIINGAYAKVPTIAGACDDEGTLFSLANMNITTDEAFSEYIQTNYLNGISASQMEQVLAAYPADPAAGSPFGTGDANALTPQYKRLAAIQGDIVFQAPRRFFLQSTSDLTRKWSYINMRGKNRPMIGTGHASDIGNWFGRGNATSYFPTDALIQFTNTQDPNVAGNQSNTARTFWPQWGSTNSSHIMMFGDEDTVSVASDDFRSEPIDLLNTVLLRLPRSS
ncbi:Carboxylic ester hydrolase [Pleurotus pulmonarius]